MMVPMYSLGAMIVRLDDGLVDLARTLPSGQSDGLVTMFSVPSVFDHPVDHVGRGRDQVEVELALQALAGDLHVQQTQKAAAEPEAQRHRGLWLVGERGVVELQPLQGVAQVGVLGAVDGIEPAIDHRLGFAVAVSAWWRRGARS